MPIQRIIDQRVRGLNDEWHTYYRYEGNDLTSTDNLSEWEHRLSYTVYTSSTTDAGGGDIAWPVHTSTEGTESEGTEESEEGARGSAGHYGYCGTPGPVGVWGHSGYWENENERIKAPLTVAARRGMTRGEIERYLLPKVELEDIKAEVV